MYKIWLYVIVYTKYGHCIEMLSMHSGDNVTYHFNVKSSSDINDSPWSGEDTKCNECVILRDNVCTRYDNVQWYGQKPQQVFQQETTPEPMWEMKID